MALRQTLEPDWVLEAYQIAAENQFPGLQTGLALEIYAQSNRITGIFFLDDKEERFIWGEGNILNQHPLRNLTYGLNIDIEYFNKKHYAGWKFASLADNDGRVYLVRPYKYTLAHIDRPKPALLSSLVAHPSESGWNLPVEHKRHFFKLPYGKKILLNP